MPPVAGFKFERFDAEVACFYCSRQRLGFFKKSGGEGIQRNKTARSRILRCARHTKTATASLLENTHGRGDLEDHC
jgi:hypothetical protein